MKKVKRLKDYSNHPLVGTICGWCRQATATIPEGCSHPENHGLSNAPIFVMTELMLNDLAERIEALEEKLNQSK